MVKFYAACIGGVFAMSLTLQLSAFPAVAAVNTQNPAALLSAAAAQADTLAGAAEKPAGPCGTTLQDPYQLCR